MFPETHLSFNIIVIYDPIKAKKHVPFIYHIAFGITSLK